MKKLTTQSVTRPISVYGIFFISAASLFFASCGGGKAAAPNDTEKTTTSTTEKKVDKPKQWTEVYKFSGSGMKKSPVFELTGGHAKVKYKYHGDASVGIGMFALYVVDDGKDIMRDGGIPDVMTQEVSEESESALQKEAGHYYLQINATGKWTVSVEEEK